MNGCQQKMKSRKEDVPGHFSLPLNELLPLCPQCHTSLEGLSTEEFMAANKNISSHPYIDFMYMSFAVSKLSRSVPAVVMEACWTVFMSATSLLLCSFPLLCVRRLITNPPFVDVGCSIHVCVEFFCFCGLTLYLLSFACASTVIWSSTSAMTVITVIILPT